MRMRMQMRNDLHQINTESIGIKKQFIFLDFGRRWSLPLILRFQFYMKI